MEPWAAGCIAGRTPRPADGSSTGKSRWHSRKAPRAECWLVLSQAWRAESPRALEPGTAQVIHRPLPADSGCHHPAAPLPRPAPWLCTSAFPGAAARILSACGSRKQTKKKTPCPMHWYHTWAGEPTFPAKALPLRIGFRVQRSARCQCVLLLLPPPAVRCPGPHTASSPSHPTCMGNIRSFCSTWARR